MIKTVFIAGKCSDLCDIQLINENDKLVESYDGYVPSNIGIGGGDYLEFQVDNATGKIIDWVPITSLKGNE